MSRDFHRARQEGDAARLRSPDRKARAIATGSPALRDRGIEQHAVVAKLHRRGRVRRQTEPGIDDQRKSPGSALVAPSGPKDIVEPSAGAYGRAPGHQHLAPRLDQSLGGPRDLRSCRGRTWNPSADKNPRRLDEAEYIGLQTCRLRRSLRA